MISGLFLVEGNGVDSETLRSKSLMNAKQLVIGEAHEFGTILHIAANAPDDLGKALLDFAQVPGVTRVTTMALRPQTR